MSNVKGEMSKIKCQISNVKKLSFVWAYLRSSSGHFLSRRQYSKMPKTTFVCSISLNAELWQELMRSSFGLKPYCLKMKLERATVSNVLLVQIRVREASLSRWRCWPDRDHVWTTYGGCYMRKILSHWGLWRGTSILVPNCSCCTWSSQSKINIQLLFSSCQQDKKLKYIGLTCPGS